MPCLSPLTGCCGGLTGDHGIEVAGLGGRSPVARLGARPVAWQGTVDAFVHLGDGKTRMKDPLTTSMVALLVSEACNIGMTLSLIHI